MIMRDGYVVQFCQAAHERVEPPLQVQKLIQVHLVTVLNILIIQLTVREYMVHVVLRAPPLQTESTCHSRHQSTILHEPRMTIVRHRVTHPSRNHLCESEEQYWHYCALSSTGDHHCAEQCDRQCSLTLPERLEQVVHLLVHLVVLDWVLGWLALGNHWERLEHFLCLLGMKTPTLKSSCT